MQSDPIRKTPRRRHLWRVLTPLFLFTVSAVLPAAAQTEVERRVAAAPDGAVEIENLAGSVVVTGWDRDEVEVTGTLGRGVRELAVEREGRTVRIEVEVRGRSERDAVAQLAVRVPRGSDLSVEVVSADVTVSDVGGTIELEGVSGDVRVDGRPRAVSVEAVSGDVAVRVAGAPTSIEAVSGNVLVTGARKRLEVSSVSGRVEATGEALERVQIESVSSNVKLDATLAPHAVVDVSSHSGNVDLHLPRTTSARFEIETYSGRIDNELGPAPHRVGRYSSQQQLEFTLGGGDGRVRVESFSGNVALKTR